MTVDVAIVGCGVHGAAAAAALSARGARVTVVERGEPAGGPTGRSSGICRAYYTHPLLAACACDSIARMAGVPECGQVRTGGLFMHPASDEADVFAAAARLASLGIDVELLSGAALAARAPGFDVSGVGLGVWEPGAGYADPAGTTSWLAAQAVSRGAELRRRTHVVAVEPGRLVLADGVVEADRILVAAGPWTRPLVQPLGVDVPLTVERHIVTTYAWGATPPVDFVWADVVTGVYGKPESGGLLCLGWLVAAPEADPDSFATRVSEEESAELLTAALPRIPRLADVAPTGGWASLYDVSPDWMPVVGEVAPGVFVDAGTSGHGFKLAPAWGEQVAALVLGEPTDPRLGDFSPTRFTAGAALSAGFGAAHILG